jgi:DNA-directed RNA polymerase subunit RPC12/RpoP
MDTRLSHPSRSLTLPSISEPSNSFPFQHKQIKREYNDCEMTQGSSLKPPMAPGLTTTVLYSPLHIDSISSNNSKSPNIQVQSDETMAEDPPERSIFCRTPPLICEQGPSAPSSPTSPGGRRKPNSLHVDALQRLDLLSPHFLPSMDYSKLSPLSPSYPTSDLGSSPRSSISITQSGIGSSHWTNFRDFKKSSSDYDGDSDICPKDLLSPGTILSPAPFSPFSDCCTDSETPYSQRSPNMSPMPSSGLHFTFEQIRSRSSMSNRADKMNADLLMPQMSLDLEARERSRSEGEMNHTEDMDTTINHSTISVPVTSNRHCQPSAYRKRMLQHSSFNDHSSYKHFQSNDSVTSSKSNFNNLSSIEQEENDLMNASVSTQVSRQPTIEEPPPDPTYQELCRASDLNVERQRQIEEWIKNQAAALEILRNSLAPRQQESNNLLQVPTAGINPALLAPSTPTTDPFELAKLFATTSSSTSGISAQQKQALWKRSRSETDVSKANNENAFVCQHCGQAFSMHDRLAKHIASRHRDRSASVNDENSKTHKCTLCPKSFGRSDMLTRHMRLHTGVKPYSCNICGQVFSRSDHLSTHQRTHTGEKPYRCPQCNYSASRRDMITRHMRTHLRPDGTPIPPGPDLQLPIAQLSLNSRSPLLTPEPQPNNNPPQFPATTLPQPPAGSNLFNNHPQIQMPKLQQHPTIANDSTDAALFAAANAATLTSLYNHQQQQMKLAQMGRSLHTQIQPDFLRRSTPNLLTIGEHTSAFRPPTPTTLCPQTSTNNLAAAAAAFASQNMNPFMLQQQTPTSTASANAAMFNAAVAAATAALQNQANIQAQAQVTAQLQAQVQAQVQNLFGSSGLSLSTQNLSTLGSPSTNSSTSTLQPSTNPVLSRQSSIGGFGFS